MIRASLLRALMAPAVLAVVLALGGCYGDGSYELPERAMKELSPQMLALLDQKNMPKDSPILVRIFKEESELEVWKKDTTGRFALLKVYPICRWSGDLGPKVREGDRQAPEGFYAITPALMNPNSNYYLAINTGFPNAYDRANGRTGAFLMIHGDCSSRGCYAMTDEEIGEIYSLAREAFLGGQQSFQIQAYPFRMTPANLARHRTNPNMAFWRMIKEGNDHFEVTRQEPKVDVCDRRYVFDAQPPPNSTKPLVFNPTGRCPAFAVPAEIAGPVQEKEHYDQVQFAQLVRLNTPVAPITTGLDGGANKVFLAQIGGSVPPARIPSPTATAAGVTVATAAAPAAGPGHLIDSLFTSKISTEPAHVADDDSASSTHKGGFFSNLFSWSGNGGTGDEKRGPQVKTAAASSRSHAARHNETAAAGLRSKPKTDIARADANKVGSTKKGEPQRADASGQAGSQEADATPPAAVAVLKGAQPVLPAGSFDSRWAAMQ